MPPLSRYTPVPSGMSFTFDTGPAPRLAYLLSAPGAAVVLSIAGTGVWTVEVLASYDGVNFDQIAATIVPGEWHVETRGRSAIAMRVAHYQSGTIAGVLAHGGPLPITNVTPVFGAFLVYSYNATPSEPPIGNQIRFNHATLAQVTKAWISNTTTDGTDQFHALRKIPHGGTMLVQERTNHLDAVLFRITSPPVDKGDYIEVGVQHQESQGTLAAAQSLLAVFNPGPIVHLSGDVEVGFPAKFTPVPSDG